MGRAPDAVVEFSSVSTFCTFPPKEVGLYTKIMFVVDQSGSNGTTDGSKQRRTDAMQDLYNKYSGNRYVEWGLISFQDSGATAFISDPYFQPASAVPAALSRFSSTTDMGGTPYKSAIFEVTAAITEDLENSTEETEANYEIIFLSDGVPTDYGTPINDQQIFDDIKRLIELAEGRIHFSTVYYNVSSNADPAAAMRLEQMAEVGAGKFLDASNGGSIDLDGLIVGGVSKEPYMIKDFFVYNLNSALCEDGLLGSDTDIDGLCDRDEENYNSRYRTLIDAKFGTPAKNFDKNNRYSFGGMYSDFIMLKHILGEGLPTCDTADAEKDSDADLLNDCEERFLVNRNPQGPTQAWTTEMLSKPKHASATNFDSDGDGIIDSLEFFFFKEKSLALDYNSIFRKIFGTYYYDMMKDHISKLKPESSSPYKIDVRQIERNDNGENCYTFDQQNLPMYQVGTSVFSQTKNLDLVHGSDENVVMVYYIMVPENDPQGKGIMRYSYQKIKFDKGAPEKQINLANDRFDHIYAK